MIPKFNPSHLAFYGVAITTVLGLFQVVTSYGKQLQAAPPFDGRYRLSLQAIANCNPPSQSTRPIILTIQQSGIYLSGFLLPDNSDEHTHRAAEKKPPLAGRYQQPEWAIAGTAPFQVCAPTSNLSLASAPPQAIRLVLRLAPDGKTLQGQLQLNSEPGIGFTGEREAAVTPQPTAH